MWVNTHTSNCCTLFADYLPREIPHMAFPPLRNDNNIFRRDSSVLRNVLEQMGSVARAHGLNLPSALFLLFRWFKKKSCFNRTKNKQPALSLHAQSSRTTEQCDRPSGRLLKTHHSWQGQAAQAGTAAFQARCGGVVWFPSVCFTTSRLCPVNN